MELMEMASEMLVSTGENAAESGTRLAFRWGVSFSSMVLLALNLIGRRSGLQATFLALILVTSLPAVIFQILRGQFGCWVAFLSFAASFFLPSIYPNIVSRFLLFVVIPDWLAYELREGVVGGVFCLILAVLLIITEVHATGGCNFSCNWRCLVYWFKNKDKCRHSTHRDVRSIRESDLEKDRGRTQRIPRKFSQYSSIS
ncbi:cold-regulated 413 plasma membrane protein 4-like isoform X2 [Silene latifolia]|uniref:cold-regulated 413 plasma membrane protein 4-like isoform X2 n=1 Tax=Silene latifolia TaxID=37657 RepID=UPI003D76FDB6